MRVTIGIDNGSTGSIGILVDDAAAPAVPIFAEVPTQLSLHYGKKGTKTHRLDRVRLREMICDATGMLPIKGSSASTRVFIERPFTGRFINSVLPAHRFFEATIIVLEDLGLGFEVVDSGTWQKPLLGKVKGTSELKEASRLRGAQLFPQLAPAITAHGDADGLLIAYHFHYHSPAGMRPVASAV